MALSSLSVSTQFITDFPIIRAGTHWRPPTHNLDANTLEPNEIGLIEFDQVHHKLVIDHDQCVAMLHVEWPEFGTIGVISECLKPLWESESLMRQFVGCDAIENQQTTQQHSESSNNLLSSSILQNNYLPIERKVYDCILFFDELSMLLLRLHLMRDAVDMHIIVESTHTFTGKPKPLYFTENKHLFAEFMHKIVVVQLNGQPTPTAARDVWQNEFNSRNALAEGLQSLGVKDSDILIIADTDEIADPHAVNVYKSVLRYNEHVRFCQQQLKDNPLDADCDDDFTLTASLRPEYYKLFVEQYLYSFDCHVEDRRAKWSKIALTTVAEAKRITKWRRDLTAATNAATGRASSTPQSHKYDYEIIDSRNYLHNEPVMPMQLLLRPGRPGGVHLSFFESVARMARKLEAYSHQNFASQFFANTTDSSTSVFNEVTELSSTSALPSGSVSLTALGERVKRGELINSRESKEGKKCERGPELRSREEIERCESVAGEVRVDGFFESHFAVYCPPETFIEKTKRMWESLAGQDDLL